MRGWQALPSAVAGLTPAPGSRPVPTGAGYGGAAALPGMLNRKLQPRRRFQIKREATEERMHAGAEIKKTGSKLNRFGWAIFPEHITGISPNEKGATAKTVTPLKLLVLQAGIEPAAPGLGILCSIP